MRLFELASILPLRFRYNRKPKNWFAWGPSENRACAVRETLRGVTFREPTGNEVVVYLICLNGRERAGDWSSVCALLRRTLAALQEQTDPRWQAIVCGQDLPDGFPDDKRITFLPFVRAPHENHAHDKQYKFVRLTAFLEANGPETGYGFILDGDDVPHRDLTSYILADNNGVGYLLDQGYMLANGLQRGRALGHRSIRALRFDNNTFFRNCGSCVAAYFDRRSDSLGLTLLRATVGARHGRLPEEAKLMGIRFGWVPFPAMCYNVLHGGNTYAGRKMPPKLAAVHREYIAEHFPGMDTPGT